MNGDLHCHSLYSDGSTDIETIITTAVKMKLSTIAVSDHDTLPSTLKLRKSLTVKTSDFSKPVKFQHVTLLQEDVFTFFAIFPRMKTL